MSFSLFSLLMLLNAYSNVFILCIPYYKILRDWKWLIHLLHPHPQSTNHVPDVMDGILTNWSDLSPFDGWEDYALIIWRNYAWEGESIISCSFEKEITKIIYSSANDQSAKLYNHEEGPY